MRCDSALHKTLLTGKPPVRVPRLDGKSATPVSVKPVTPEANRRFDSPACRQGLQMRPLCQNGVGPRSVAPGHHKINEASAVLYGREVAVAAQDQRLCNGGPEMPVLRVHRADMFPAAVDRDDVMSRCGNGWPAIITPGSSAWVKSARFCVKLPHFAQDGAMEPGSGD